MTELKPLSELIEISKGKKVRIINQKTKNSVPYLLIDTLRGKEPEFFTEDKNYTEARNTDILMVFDGANSGLVGTGLSGAIGSTIGRLRPKKEVNTKYLTYFISLNFSLLNKDTKGSAIPHVKPKNLLELKIRYTSIKEQFLIVAEIEKHLTRLDEAVKNLKSVKEKLKIYRKSVLKAAFEGKIIPSKFEYTKIKDVSLFTQYGTSKKANIKGKIPVLRMGDLENGKISYIKLKFFDKIDDELKEMVLENGDILFNRTNSTELVGKTSIFEKKLSPYEVVVFASYLIRIKVDKNIIIPEYLNHWLNSPEAQHVKNSLISQQVGQANINGTKLKNIQFPLTRNKETQQKIVQEIESRFSVIDKVEEVVEQSLEKAETLRKSILKSAFEGRLISI